MSVYTNITNIPVQSGNYLVKTLTPQVKPANWKISGKNSNKGHISGTSKDTMFSFVASPRNDCYLVTVKQNPAKKVENVIITNTVVFEDYVEHAERAWSCCNCAAINVGQQPTCLTCKADVTGHSARAFIPSGHFLIPKFGLKGAVSTVNEAIQKGELKISGLNYVVNSINGGFQGVLNYDEGGVTKTVTGFGIGKAAAKDDTFSKLLAPKDEVAAASGFDVVFPAYAQRVNTGYFAAIWFCCECHSKNNFINSVCQTCHENVVTHTPKAWVKVGDTWAPEFGDDSKPKSQRVKRVYKKRGETVQQHQLNLDKDTNQKVTKILKERKAPAQKRNAKAIQAVPRAPKKMPVMKAPREPVVNSKARSEIKRIMQYYTSERPSSVVVPSDGSQSGYAPAVLHENVKLSFRKDTTTSGPLTEGQCAIATSLDEGHTCILTDYTGSAWGYTLWTQSSDLTDATKIVDIISNQPTIYLREDNVDFDVPIVYGTPNAGQPWEPFGNFWPMCRLRDLSLGRFFLGSPGMVVEMTTVDWPLETHGLEMGIWKAGGPDTVAYEPVGGAPFIDGAASYTLTDYGWFKITLAAVPLSMKTKKVVYRKGVRSGVKTDIDANWIGNIQIAKDADAGVNCLLRQFALPNLAEKATSVKTTSVDCVLTWLMNASPPIDKQGTVVMARLGQDENYLEYFDYDKVGRLGMPKLSDDINLAAKGAYAWNAPVTVQGTNLRTAFEIQDNTVFDTYCCAFPESGTNILVVNAGPDMDAQNWTMRAVTKIRSYTDDSWSVLIPSNVASDNVRTAITGLGKLDFSRPNENHEKSLETDISKIVGLAEAVIPLAL